MIAQVKIYVGLNDGYNKFLSYESKTAKSKMIKLLGESGFIGATLYDATGVWQGETEKSVIIELLFVEDMDAVKELCQKLKKQFNQQEVLFTVTSLLTAESI